jgi:hypothetical protein
LRETALHNNWSDDRVGARDANGEIERLEEIGLDDGGEVMELEDIGLSDGEVVGLDDIWVGARETVVLADGELV